MKVIQKSTEKKEKVITVEETLGYTLFFTKMELKQLRDWAGGSCAGYELFRELAKLVDGEDF